MGRILNTPAYERDLKRWYPLIEHPVQRKLVQDKVRFKVVPAGRRSGKTERAKRFVAREALSVPGNYFLGAPTRDQAKRIFWTDIKQLTFTSIYKERPLESDLIIRIPNGSMISVIGLDQPQRMEGVTWKGGVIDEIADVKEGAWEENISPALDTFDPLDPDYRAWCWLIGVPEGYNHYYDMAQKAGLGNDPDWELYTWKSSEILPPDIIESAKRRMSARQFRQEYEASFETALGRIYEDYGLENTTKEEAYTHEELLWFHDFNFSPLSSGIGVCRGGIFYIIDEIVLESAVARQSAVEFIDKFANHQNKKVTIYGDPAGRAGEKHGHSSDYTEIEHMLRTNGWTLERKVKGMAPAIRDRQNSVRAMVCNAAGERKLFINANKAPYAHKGMSTVQIKKGSTFLEAESEFQHITTAIGYCCDYEWPIRREEETVHSPNMPSKNYYNR